MHQRRLYGLAFLAVLLLAAAGAYTAAKAVGQVDVQLPRLDFLASVQEIVGDVNITALIPRRNASSASTQPTAEPTISAGQPSPQAIAAQDIAPAAPPVTSGAAVTATVALEPAAPTETLAATSTPAERPTATPAPPTPTPTAAPQPATSTDFPFVPAGAVRHSSGDCAGPSIRGTVRDAAGNPLPGVPLWRYDQWGNQQTIASKSGAADLGQYDFPLGDIANVHYVQVVDAGGVPISPVVAVQHRQGDAPDAACHWLDWVRR